MATVHSHVTRLLAELLRLTFEGGTHVKLLQRGGDSGAFAHVKVIGPSLAAPAGENALAQNAHLAVTLANGEVAVTQELSSVPGVVPRLATGPQLGNFAFKIDPLSVDANGRTLEMIVRDLVGELQKQNLW